MGEGKTPLPYPVPPSLTLQASTHYPSGLTHALLLEPLWKHRNQKVSEFPTFTLQMVGKQAIPVLTRVDKICFWPPILNLWVYFFLVNVDTRTAIQLFYIMSLYLGTLYVK